MFYVLRIFRDVDGMETRNVTSFDSFSEAEKRYYACIASDIKEDMPYVMCMIIREDAYIMESKVFDRREV